MLYRYVHQFVSMFLFVLLCSCSRLDQKTALYKKLSRDDLYNKYYLGHYKIGNPYTIKNETYTPSASIEKYEIGVASWYGTKKMFHKKKTANGDLFNKNILTAAHRTLPLPSIVKITNLKNNKTIVVMVNDRGPFHGNRIIDVSERVAETLNFKNIGVTKVKIEYLKKDTDDFLRNIGLQKKPGAVINKKNIPNSFGKCSINCQIQLLNIKHNTSLKQKLFKNG